MQAATAIVPLIAEVPKDGEETKVTHDDKTEDPAQWQEIRDDPEFIWTTNQEPHATRRKLILAAYPEVTKLMGPEPLTKFLVPLVMALQVGLAYLLRDTHPFSWQFLVTAYAVGAIANQNLFLAVHEITHGLAFRSAKANKAFAIFANFPVCIPFAMSFKNYHTEHHKFLAQDGVDMDLPTRVEALFLNSVAGKAFFVCFQIMFYCFRPTFLRSQKVTAWHVANFAAQIAFDALIVKTMGWYAMSYLLMSSFLAGSLHPVATHFISEHYLMEGGDQETTSYYGPLNIFMWNVGYHNEHHDFPFIPWSRLPQLYEIAKPFYGELQSHNSYTHIMLKFIFDQEISLFSRVKRQPQQSASKTPGSAPLSKTNSDEKLD